jgi:hypothetical protein
MGEQKKTRRHQICIPLKEKKRQISLEATTVVNQYDFWNCRKIKREEFENNKIKRDALLSLEMYYLTHVRRFVRVKNSKNEKPKTVEREKNDDDSDTDGRKLLDLCSWKKQT